MREWTVPSVPLLCLYACKYLWLSCSLQLLRVCVCVRCRWRCVGANLFSRSHCGDSLHIWGQKVWMLRRSLCWVHVQVITLNVLISGLACGVLTGNNRFPWWRNNRQVVSNRWSGSQREGWEICHTLFASSLLCPFSSSCFFPILLHPPAFSLSLLFLLLLSSIYSYSKHFPPCPPLLPLPHAIFQSSCTFSFFFLVPLLLHLILSSSSYLLPLLLSSLSSLLPFPPLHHCFFFFSASMLRFCPLSFPFILHSFLLIHSPLCPSRCYFPFPPFQVRLHLSCICFVFIFLARWKTPKHVISLFSWWCMLIPKLISCYHTFSKYACFTPSLPVVFTNMAAADLSCEWCCVMSLNRIDLCLIFYS